MQQVNAPVDLGQIRANQIAKERTPPFDPGTPEFVLTAGLPSTTGKPTFTAALDHVAASLAEDGWSILEVKQIAVVGHHAEQGVFLYQVSVVVKPIEPEQ